MSRTEDEIKIRPISFSDCPIIASAKNFGFSDCWSLSVIEKSFDSGRFFGFAIESERENPAVSAFITLSQGYDDADIESVFTFPDQRKKGYADKLLETAEAEVLSRKLKKIFLEVRISNLAAIDLYLKHGYVKINERKSYYADGESAAVFVKEL